MEKVSLEDVMFEHPIKVKETVTVGVVSHLLLRYKINGILVVKDDNENELVGIFTATDLLNVINKALTNKRQRIEELKRAAKLSVGEVATKKVVVLQKSTKITKAIALMHRKNLHMIPICDGNKLVGVVGRNDLLDLTLNFYK